MAILVENDLSKMGSKDTGSVCGGPAAQRRKIWIMAGESSGDMFGARLAEALWRLDPSLEISGMGGAAMEKAGVRILADSRELGVVGFVEVFKNIFTFIGLMRRLDRLAGEERPDVVVPIDYPGFNIRFAERMWRKGIKVAWYITPQVWAWGKGRIPKLARICRKMMVIFPFETEVYAGTGLDVQFVGNPLVEIVGGRTDPSIHRDPNRILLLPGSRGNEIKRLLKPMLDTVAELHPRHPELTYVIGGARPKICEHIRRILDAYGRAHPGRLPKIDLASGETPKLLQEASAGMSASGTMTVEAGIAGVPLVVMYKLNYVTLLFAALLVKLYRGFFTMNNIIADKTVFEEYLQWRACPKNLVPAMERILPGGSRREWVLEEMRVMRETMLRQGDSDSSENAAKAVLDVARQS